MNLFFFQRKLKKQIRSIDVPLNPQFLSSLRTSLVSRAEEDRSQSFFTTMKLHKRALSFSVIPVGIAIAIFAVQLAKPNNNGVLDIPQVLADSIAHTFQLNNTEDFTHQTIRVEESVLGVDAEDFIIETWMYQENSRLSFQSTTRNSGEAIAFEYLISAYDNQACEYANIPERDALVECDETIAVNMAQLIPGSLVINDLQITDVSEEERANGFDFTVVWNSTVTLDPQASLAFSRNNSGYYDAGSGALEPSATDNGIFTYQEHVARVEPGNENIHLGSYDTQLIQIQTPQESSPVYEVNLLDKTVRLVTAEQLAEMQAEYKRARRTLEAEVQSTQEMYNDMFDTALELQTQIGSLTPLAETDEEYRGQRAVRVRYGLTDEVKSQEQFVGMAEVEFVLDVQEKHVLEYTIVDVDGRMMEHISVEESEVVEGVDPAEFFSVEYWKKEIGVE